LVESGPKRLGREAARISVCRFLYRQKDADGMERVRLVSTMEETELSQSLT
jgi:hypothetical protein